VESLMDGCLCRSRCSIVTKRLSGCRWDVVLSKGVMDAVEESGEFMEKAELSCIGRSEESKMGSETGGKSNI